MYRKAELSDVEEIMKIPNINISKEEVKNFLTKSEKYIYVYENDDNNIVSATFFGADNIDDDDYDSEIYGIYTRNIKNKDLINSEILYETKRELFEKGYRSLIVWCDERNDKMRKFLESSGGVESRKRENNKKIEVAYTYKLNDLYNE